MPVICTSDYKSLLFVLVKASMIQLESIRSELFHPNEKKSTYNPTINSHLGANEKHESRAVSNKRL